MAESANVSVEHRGRVAILTISHPPANALNAAVLAALDSAVDAAHNDPQIKALVITGAGQKFFLAGADINELLDIDSPDAGRALSERGQAIFSRIEKGEKPAIAAINGFALGGGCELAMACHLRVASDNAKFGQPEINLGIIPGYGGTQRLPRLIGATHAMEWTLTGRIVGVDEAASLGLVNQTTTQADLLGTAMKLADTITSKGGRAVAATLEAILTAGSTALDEGLRREAALFGGTTATHDFREGASAFLEKRAPAFTDQ